jgi:uncharacterized protein
MQCPKCDSIMEVVEIKGHQANRCTRCQGLWFDHAAHKVIKREKGAEKIDIGDAEVGKGYDHMTDVPCPRCESTLARVPDRHQRHIHYDICPQGHGVFFDAGEFRDFVVEDLGDFFRDLPWFKTKG